MKILSILVCMIEILGLMYFSNEKLMENPNGKKMLNSTELLFKTFISWRADSSFKSDTKSAKRLFGFSSVICAVIFILLNKLDLTGCVYLAFLFVFCFLIWGALEWATNPLKETWEWIRPFLIIIFIPFAFYFSTIDSPDYIQSLLPFKKIFELLGITITSNFDLIVCLTLSIVLFLIGICLVWLFMNSFITCLFFTLSWTTAKVFRAVKTEGEKNNYSLIVFVIMAIPILATAIINLL